MTTYTNVNKPSQTAYTNQNLVGKEQYDQSSISYDDSSVYYDSFNYSEYTKVSKPDVSSPTTIFVDINESDWNGSGGLANPVGTYATTPYTATFVAYVNQYIVGNTSSIPSVVLGVLQRMAVLSNGSLSSQETLGLNNGRIKTPEFSIYTKISKP